MLDVDYYVDDRVGGRFRGWAWLPDAAELMLAIEVAAPDGTVVAAVKAGDFRADLADAGKRGGACGFVIRVPAVCPSGLYTLRARYGDLAVALAEPEWFEAPWVAAAWPPRQSAPTIDDSMHAAALPQTAGHADEPTALSPGDLAALDAMLAAARPEVLICRDLAPPLMTFLRERLAPLGLEGPTIVERRGPSTPAALDEAIGIAERVCVLFQPLADEAMLAETVAQHARLVSAGGFIVILRPPSHDCSIAMHRLLAADPRFVTDRQDFGTTTAPLGVLRRRPDPRRRDGGSALDELEGI